jgi:acyl-CoA oxidase
MEESREGINEAWRTSDMPWWLVPKLKELKINGLNIKDFGGPGFSNLETGFVTYEIAKVDPSIATFYLVHNAIGQCVVEALGDDEQRKRVLSETINMDKYCAFGLTEPDFGSDASGLQTTATKVEGGYLINGKKRWIGNATFADYIVVWAKNPAANGNIQGFLVTKGSKGLTTTKIENKYSLRIVQNADIIMENVFVPDNNKLTKANDFATGTNVILEASRLAVAWMIVGVACGAYEAALKYCL